MAVQTQARLASEVHQGERLRKAGDFKGAAQHFGRVVEAFEAGRLTPADQGAVVQAYLGWARSWLALDEYDRAIKALDRAASRFTDPEVHARRGILLEDLNRKDEAVAEYLKVVPKYQRLAKSTNDPELARRYARVLKGLGRKDDADAAFEQARELYEAAPHRTDPDLLSGYAWVLDEVQAEASAKRANQENAVAAYEAALALRPLDYIALFNRAVVLDNMSESAQAERYPDALARAEQAYRDVLESYPDDPDGNAGLGWMLDKMGRYVEARASCQKAREIQADNPFALLGLGFAQARLGNSAEAEQAYREANDRNPHDADTLGNLASLLLDLDRAEEAQPLINEAVKLAPTSWNWLATRAAIEVKLAEKYQDQDLYSDAIDDVRQATTLRRPAARVALPNQPEQPDPQGAQLQLTLANALTGQGKYSPARSALKRARALAPDSEAGLRAARNLRRLQDRLPAASMPTWLVYLISALAGLAILYGLAVQGMKFDSAGFVGFVTVMIFVVFAAFSLPAITSLKLGPAEFEKSSGTPTLSSIDKS